MRLKDPRPTALVRCPHCKATRPVAMEKYNLGDVLQPFPGGGTYGRCLRCKRTGLVVVEVPKEEPILPIGWVEIPKE